MNRKWLYGPLIAVALAVGVIGGSVAFAQTEEGEEAESVVNDFASRVAAILGLDETQVRDAMQQAGREMQNEAVQQRLDRLVEAGRLTQEEADAYLEWYQARPEGLPLGPGIKRGFRGFHGGFGPCPDGPEPAPEETPTAGSE